MQSFPPPLNLSIHLCHTTTVTDIGFIMLDWTLSSFPVDLILMCSSSLIEGWEDIFAPVGSVLQQIELEIKQSECEIINVVFLALIERYLHPCSMKRLSAHCRF